MRVLVPAETLVYLETNDLAAALQPIVDSKPFTEVAKSKPDFSALKGVQLAVAVTGFETSEEKLTDEHSVGRVQPHFVAVAETHAWNYQAVGFAEKKLGAFVAGIYDSEPTLEKTDKNGGKYFTWTAKDGRKAYALVTGSLIYFGNDESAIEKCLAVKRGESDSIAKTGKIPLSDPKALASGYVSTDGVAQIANIVGLKFASETGEDSEVQSGIAGILPQLLRSSITEISWTATKTDEGIEDKYKIAMPPDVANVFNETMAPGDKLDPYIIAQLPDSVSSVTVYNLKNPPVAWRSLILTAQEHTNPLAGKIVAEFSAAFFEPYGIRDPQLFLSLIDKAPAGRTILSAKLTPESEPIIIVTGSFPHKFLKSLTPELKPPPQIIEGNTNIWSTPDGEMQARFDLGSVLIGSKANLAACSQLVAREIEDVKSKTLHKVALTKATIATAGEDNETVGQIAEMVSEKKPNGAKATSNYFTETRFTKSGMERRTVSDFGLIGSIIAQLGAEQ